MMITTYQLYQVAPHMADEFFPLVCDRLNDAIKRCNSDETLAHLRGKLSKGLAQLWIISRNGMDIVAAGTTEILNSNSGLRILQVSTLGGSDLEQWVHLWPKIEMFAKQEHCDKVRLHGRVGWSKILKDYHEPWRTFEKDL